MNDKPVEPASSDDELARKIETHLTLDEGSPGFLLNKTDFRRIVRALRRERAALDTGLDELERVTALWSESELKSKDFQTMLLRLCRRIDKRLPLDEIVRQARDLLVRKGTHSILRDETIW